MGFLHLLLFPVACLFICLFDRLAGRLFDCSCGFALVLLFGLDVLAGCLVDWSVDWLFVCLFVGRVFVCLFVSLFVHLLISLRVMVSVVDSRP